MILVIHISLHLPQYIIMVLILSISKNVILCTLFVRNAFVGLKIFRGLFTIIIHFWEGFLCIRLPVMIAEALEYL